MKSRETKEMRNQKAGSWDIDAIIPPQIAVSIDKDKGSRAALKWTLENIVNRGQTLLLIHVKHKNCSQPNDNESYAKEIFLPFRCFCSRKEVICKDVILEDDDIARGIIEYTTQNAIEKLVLGASSRRGLSRLKPYDVATTISKEAPDFCTVYIISNGKVSSCRNATRPAPAPAAAHFRPEMGTVEEDAVIDDGISSESYSSIISQHPQFMIPRAKSIIYMGLPNINSENEKPAAILLEKKDLSKKIEGHPTISFTESEFHASLKSIRSLALVRCPHGAPDLASTRRILIQRLSPVSTPVGSSSSFSILQWKKYSFLVNFRSYEDYLKALVLESFSQGNFTFRFSKWFPGYLHGGESPFLPTWIEFPDLDINWHKEEFITALGSCFGKVLKVAETTKKLEEGAEARVCVERDISCPLPGKMWIDINGEGYWQKVRGITKPKYCSWCYKRGHDTKECRKNSSKKPQHNNPNDPKEVHPCCWTPKTKKTNDQIEGNATKVDPDVSVSTRATSTDQIEDPQITKFITSIEKDLFIFLQEQAKSHFSLEPQNHRLDNAAFNNNNKEKTIDKTTNQEQGSTMTENADLNDLNPSHENPPLQDTYSP